MGDNMNITATVSEYLSEHELKEKIKLNRLIQNMYAHNKK